MTEEEEERIFVTSDKKVRQREGKLDEDDLSIIESVKTGEGFIEIETAEQLEALGKSLVKIFNHFRGQCRESMNQEQANFIRMLRVEEGYSWRAVSRACHGNKKFDSWDLWNPPSSQPMGMALCEKAAEFFGESYREEPWN